MFSMYTYLLLFLTIGTLPSIYQTSKSITNNLTVLSFNMWNGGQNRNITAMQYADYIKSRNVDIACLQETSTWVGGEDNPDQIILENLAPVIAKILGWNVYIQRITDSYSTAIVSRFNHTNLHYYDNVILAVEFKLESEKKVLIINDHLNDEPYQPEYLSRMAANTTDPAKVKKMIEEAEFSAYHTRAKIFFKKLKHVFNNVNDINMPVFITADYNEPSHLDWTARTVESKLTPFAVNWPVSKGIYKYGFTDSYRALYPDEVQHSIKTWSMAWEDQGQGYRFDRIDIIYYLNTVVKSITHEDTGFSDHQAVIGTYDIGLSINQNNISSNSPYKMFKNLRLRNIGIN